MLNRSEPAPPLLVIAGPTGVGKTEAAVQLAERIPMDVVSADSRQVYRRMDIATGKPTPAQLKAVRHHLIDVVDPCDRYHAARFRHEALAAIEDIRRRGRLPVVVGGTGLYIRGLLRGLAPAPPGNLELRRDLLDLEQSHGVGTLHRRLARVDPEAARRIFPKDKVRIIRALEIYHQTGHPFGTPSHWRESRPPWNLLMIGLTMPRQTLAPALQRRVEVMVARGLRAEVEGLLEAGYGESLPAMNGIGYRHFAWVIRGRLSEAEAIRLMKRDTLRYAKRQRTWFAREPELRWIDVPSAGGPDGAAEAIAKLTELGGLMTPWR
ncbi:MAG: tRNA (adenosine(37)-N6)-dimethylallyltransferase MiaA [Candidatus Rokubacteria bacterium]|nr:tRNA (adenosine(37)-N6)-dimethylallyltransferase MiaA [Candidatus Rokubacteria bacterium]